MTPTPLAKGREFDLIRALTRDTGALPPSIVVGPGDDAAVFGEGWVVSCDLSVESVHFRLDWMSPEEAGSRAVRSALSDLAAMGARPVGVLVSLAGSADHMELGALEAVGQGARAAAEAEGAIVMGGDVSRSPGPLVVDVVVLGRAADPVRRSGARPGHEVFVTGALGGAATAVHLLEKARPVPDALRRRFVAPRPRTEVSTRLVAAARVGAMIDVSDGLMGDAEHIAAASQVAVEIHADRVPLEPAAVGAVGAASALEWALRGGEDYELLFTPPPAERAAVEGCANEDLAATRIGRVVEGEGVRVLDAEGGTLEVGGSWDHFGAGGR